MAALSFNWPATFYQHHNDTTDVLLQPPPSFLPFHDNNGINSLPLHNSIIYPTLSYNNNNPLASLPNTGQEYYSANPLSVYDQNDQFFPFNNSFEQTQPEYSSYETYPLIHDTFPMEPDMYDFGNVCNNVVIDQDVEMEEHKGNDNLILPLPFENKGKGNRRLSAQSMAARVRRRKISGKTLELGKLVPGGHRMTTAEMFQAAYKYIKFLQVQVGVLQLMSSSPELGEELQVMLTAPSVQEKLYTAEKCIVSQTLAKTLADDHQK